MKNFSTWLVVLFMAMFWVFRVIVALMAQLNLDFGGITPLNSQLEIILLFVVLVCIILVAKRKLICGLIKKTDWFYKNDEFDREFDDRADKNNYRTM